MMFNNNLRCRMETVLTTLYNPLEREAVFFWYLLLLQIIYCGMNQYVQEVSFYTRDWSWELLKVCIYVISGIANAYFWTYMIDVLRNHRWAALGVRWFVLGISNLVLILDIYCYVAYHGVFNQSFFELVMTTNPNTVKEYFSIYLFTPKVLAILMLLILSFWGGQKLIKHNLKMLQHFTLICRPVLICLLIISVATTASIFLNGAVYGGFLGRARTFSPLPKLAEIVWYGYLTIDSFEEIERIATEQPQGVIANDSDTPYVIFVLGESTDRNHMSIYGYNLETTPYQEARSKEGELTAFTDVIAPGNYTNLALSYIFSFREKGEAKHYYEYANLISIMKEAGYHTYWISNQETAGIDGSTARLYAELSDECYFTMLRDSTTSNRVPDGKLLNLLDECLAKSYGKNFYVLHLEGTHEDYKLRFPSSYSHFKAEDEEGISIQAKEHRADYDNAVLYNDYVIEEIIRRFEDKNAILVYFSDHGSEVYEGRDFMGHSSEEEGNRHMIEIPFIIWRSKIFAEKNPDLDVKIASSADNPYMTDDFIHTLLDILRIRTEDYSPYKSIINDKFDVTRPRIYSNKEYHKE